MFYQMGHIISERDQSFTDNTHLRLEKELLLQERQRAKSPRPFSPPPATGHLNVDSPSMAASKEKLRMLTEEIVEKLETDAVKFKEKLRDLEYLKKRAEELKEENVILLDNRQLLREQLSSLSNKEERIG
ncbi:Protein Daple [Exaiptasia diaphana]|nr:Protein Daple [Exaiptasia diaphana]